MKQPHFTSNHCTQKRSLITYRVGNQVPGLGQAEQCGSVISNLV